MRPWTSAEEEALRQLGPRIGGPACAAAFGRSVEAVRVRAKRLGVSLRRAKTSDPIPTRCRTEAVLRRIRTLAEAELCPCCGKRPVGIRATGLCWKCHYEALCAVHDEERERVEGQLALWAARSKLQRRRRALALAFPACEPETGDGPATIETQPVTSSRKDHDA